MSDKHLSDLELDAFFSAGREQVIEPSPDLLARVLADAESTHIAQAETARATPQKSGFLSELFSGLGGWPSLASLATAAIAGVWIGISPPAALEDLASTYLSDDSESYLIELMPGADNFLVEG
jgi:hypothetical protein